VYVKEGIRNGDLVEIFGDIEEGASVLKNPSEEIKEGKIAA